MQTKERKTLAVPPSTDVEMLKYFAAPYDPKAAEETLQVLHDRLASTNRAVADAAVIEAVGRFGLKVFWPEEHFDLGNLEEEVRHLVQHRIGVWYGEVQRTRSKAVSDKEAHLLKALGSVLARRPSGRWPREGARPTIVVVTYKRNVARITRACAKLPERRTPSREEVMKIAESTGLPREWFADKCLSLCPDCAHTEPTPSHPTSAIVASNPRRDGAATVRWAE
jgi:hypothetical protein